MAGDRRARVRLTVTGRLAEADVSGRRSLAEFLREDLGLTGTHVGCEHGVCGACTVLVDGQSARSCLLFAVQQVFVGAGLIPPARPGSTPRGTTRTSSR
jgi:carbon-monoxide dehydrogenase small subunit